MKRVYTEAELLDLIDNLDRMRRDRLAKSQSFKVVADELYREHGEDGDDWNEADHFQELHAAREYRARERHYGKLAASAKKRLEMYKQKLSIMRTDTFPGILPDRSVLV